MTHRPYWTTLNLAALWLAAVAAENQLTGLTSLPDVGACSPLRRLVAETEGAVLREHEVLEAAVVLERVGGGEWAELAAVLGGTPEAVAQRFAPVERSFRLAEAFPGMLGDAVPGPVAGASVLRFPDASRRWLVTALARRGTAEPRFAVDDATWRRHEREALALMERALRAGDLPPHVDLLAARFDLEHRRVTLLVAEQGEEPAAAPRIADALERGVRACDELSLRVRRRAAAQRVAL
jgi:hypothetical protein